MAKVLKPGNAPGEVVPVQKRPVPAGNDTVIKDHPLAGSAGVFANDPLWDDFIQAMEEAKRELDAAYPVSE